jgi:hyperosmotically inducible periplasmic protein
MKNNKTMNRICSMAVLCGVLVASTATYASDTDDRIEDSAKKSYVFKTYLKDDAIKMDSKNGKVTLTGTVAIASHKSLAEDTVESLPGVKSVDNQLKIKGEAPEEYSDMWLTTKVKTTLLFHRNVSSTGTDVFVKDGVVSLRGEAASMAEKELTAEYAQDIEGVKEVKNEMTVAATPSNRKETIGEKIDDASITAQVKSTLLSHRSTSALKTKVTTVEGVVTVSGTAKNAAEKSLVTKLVSDINGVVSVENNMVVAPVAAK